MSLEETEKFNSFTLYNRTKDILWVVSIVLATLAVIVSYVALWRIAWSAYEQMDAGYFAVVFAACSFITVLIVFTREESDISGIGFIVVIVLGLVIAWTAVGVDFNNNPTYTVSEGELQTTASGQLIGVHSGEIQRDLFHAPQVLPLSARHVIEMEEILGYLGKYVGHIVVTTTYEPSALAAYLGPGTSLDEELASRLSELARVGVVQSLSDMDNLAILSPNYLLPVHNEWVGEAKVVSANLRTR